VVFAPAAITDPLTCPEITPCSGLPIADAFYHDARCLLKKKNHNFFPTRMATLSGKA